MKIQKVTITKEELVKAVESYLNKTYGIKLTIESVDKEYSYSQEYQVEVKIEEAHPVLAIPSSDSVESTFAKDNAV